jgi:hypothetical protein
MVIDERVKSSFDISIATGLALESILEPTHNRYDKNRVIPNRVNLAEYDSIYFNLATLTRNIIASFQGNIVMTLNKNDISSILNYEIEVILENIKQVYPTVKVHFYYSDYDQVFGKIKHPAVRVRLPTTQRQLHLDKISSKGIDDYYMLNEPNVLHFKREFTPVTPNEKAIILTSFPVDLCSYNKFKKLDLLESSTGALKSRHLWYTKYYKGQDLNFIPFNCKLLKVFGDSVHYHPFDFKVRNMFIDLAKENNWTPLTTLDKVMHDVSKLRDKYLVEVFKLI